MRPSITDRLRRKTMRTAWQPMIGSSEVLLAVCATALISISACDKPTADSDSTQASKPVARITPLRADLPNVLLISIDSLRPDHLGCYGYKRDTSPRIDRLASEGALFETVISSTSWTLPAHAALFTGLPDSVHGCLDTSKPLADNRLTMAERLKKVGYTTAGFFSGPYLHPVFGLAQGFDEYVDCTAYPDLSDEEAKKTGMVDGEAIFDAATEDVTNPRVYERVAAWLRRPPARPFFLFIHMWDVHYDFIPPPPYDKKFDPDYTGWVTGRNVLHDARIVHTMPKRDLEHLIALYDGEIGWTDQHVGMILDVFDELGWRDSTLVIVTSDHGTEFFEHGLKTHRQTLYDEVIRIPLIMRFPGRITPGGRFAQQARIIDVLPTVLDLAGLDEPDDVMGRSLTSLLDGGTLHCDAPAIAELLCDGRRLQPDGKWAPRNPNFLVQQQLRAYRRPEWKLLLDLNERRTLAFDLRSDPEEQTPLAELPKSILDDARRADDWLRQYRSAMPPPGSAAPIPVEVLQKLRAVGYLGDDADDDEPDLDRLPTAPESSPTSAPSADPSEPPAP